MNYRQLIEDSWCNPEGVQRLIDYEKEGNQK